MPGGSRQRHTEGYPLGGWWQRPYTFSDDNGDGNLSFGEVEVADADSAEFMDEIVVLPATPGLWS